MLGYGEFFRRATSHDPFPYQVALACREDSPSLALSVPTGTGKTFAVVCAWLWRRRSHPDESVRAATPRRLVYCLPMRVLVEQTVDAARQVLQRLDVGDVGVHAVLGGDVDDTWADRPERDAILVGTQDMLLSRALNRGFAASRFRWPRLFGLLHNDALWVCDEVQLMGAGLATAAQLAAFRQSFGTFGSASVLFLSATLKLDWLRTVDFDPSATPVLALGAADRDHPGLVRRLRAAKRLEQLAAYSPRELAAAVAELHQPGQRTLVVLNRVERAKDVFRALLKRPIGHCVLLHSRFRRAERARALAEALRDPPDEGTIVVATQVVEAGVDLDASTLVLDLAPWSSVVQRLGRCNRVGRIPDARAWWIDVPDRYAHPYQPAALRGARERLLALGGDASPHRVASEPLDDFDPPRHVVRRRDLLELFDTTPDISGLDVDVSRFIRDDPEKDVHVFWRTIQRTPDASQAPPTTDELCRVPIPAVSEHLGKRSAHAWVFDHLEDRWRPIRGGDLRPGMRVLLDGAEGGYDASVGFDSGARGPVPPVGTPAPVDEESVSDDVRAHARTWIGLADHSNHVVDAVRRLINLAPDFEQELELAARWHDAGKAHPLFQQFLKSTGGDPPQGGIWAKSPGRGGRHERPYFRHELASALALLEHREGADLAAYLVAAHHGKVRLVLRSLPAETAPPDGRRFAFGIWEGDELPACDLGGGARANATPLSLDVMEIGSSGSEASWTERVLSLLECLGPFRLAYLEALVRAADSMASRQEEESHA